MSPRFPGVSAIPRMGVCSQRGLALCAFLLALPLAALSLAPASTFARPASPRAFSIGKTASPAVDLTLHYRSTISGLGPLSYMTTDTQGNLYITDSTVQLVRMYDLSDHLMRNYGSGKQGTGNGSFNNPLGVAVGGGVVYVADYGNRQIQFFNQSNGTFIGQFGAGTLTGPEGLALSSNGTLYVVDDSNQVFEYSPSGILLGSFGASGTGNGQFNGPTVIAMSRSGMLYILDTGNQRVEAFTLDGTYVTQWGHSAFVSPISLAVDRAGMVYVVDYYFYTVYKFDPSGSLVGTYTARPSTPFVPGTFVFPVGIAVRSTVNTPISVYVAENPGTTGYVQRFDQVVDPQTHIYQSQWGGFGSATGLFDAPQGVAVDQAGNIYVADGDNNRVEKFDKFGKFLLAFGGTGNSNGQFRFPTDVAFSPDGNTLYVTDHNNNRIEEFNTTGTYLGQFGTGGNSAGQFNNPYAIASDGTHLYVADTDNNRIEVFDTSGHYVSQFGSGPGSGSTQFNYPFGIAVDIARQEIFIADNGNNRVQVYTTGGSYVASLTSAAGIALHQPVGVSTDQRGDVYVADQLNDRIVEFDVNLTRTTAFGTSGSGNGQFAGPTDAVVGPTNGQLYVVDEGNNRIERFGSPWGKHDTVGIYRPSTKTFYLRNENSTGPADIVVPMPYAQTGDLPVVGDWNGDGVDTVGLYRTSTGTFLLQDANVQEAGPDYTFTLGNPGDTPIAGDWNGQGFDGAGIFRPSNGILYLRNSLSTGYADEQLVLGVPGDKGIAGDWNGDGQDSPGVYRPSNQTFYVTNKVTNGIIYADATAVLGVSGDAPFTGDWPFQGSSGIGVFRPSNGITYEKNAISTGFADNHFVYGVAGDMPVAGQWMAPSMPFTAPPPHVSRAPDRTATNPCRAIPHPRGRPCDLHDQRLQDSLTQPRWHGASLADRPRVTAYR